MTALIAAVILATSPLLALFPLAGYLAGLLAAHWRGRGP